MDNADPLYDAREKKIQEVIKMMTIDIKQQQGLEAEEIMVRRDAK